MCWSRIACDRLEPSHAGQGSQSVEGRSVRFKGVDTSASPRRPRHTEDDIACTERALASFHAAVAKDYGLEEAARAAADWIEELKKANADEHPDWRSVTAGAAHRLALRVVDHHPYS